MDRLTNVEMKNRIRRKSDQLIREIRRKITAERAINATKWDKKSTWTKLLGVV